MEQLLALAIASRNLVEFWYDGHQRTAEPHVLGVCGGMRQLLGYQVGGSSNTGGLPDWRRYDLDRIFSLSLLPQTFPGPRPTKSGKHSNWDRQIAAVI